MGLQRKTPMRRGPSKKVKAEWHPDLKAPPAAKKEKKPLGAGKKTKEWESVRKKLKVEFKRVGITTCELGYPGCWRDSSLGFSHAHKRRNLAPGEIEVVILLCSANCHPKIEILPEAEMAEIVHSVIKARKTPVRSIFV